MLLNLFGKKHGGAAHALRIVNAQYDSAAVSLDVTAQIRALVVDGRRLTVTTTASMRELFGDTCVGVPKRLRIQWERISLESCAPAPVPALASGSVECASPTCVTAPVLSMTNRVRTSPVSAGFEARPAS